MNVHEMRKIFVVIAVLAVVGIVPALAQAASIAITKTGFVPSSVTIHSGESITWTNSDAVDHQVSSTKASLASPVMHSGQSYSFMFATAGNFSVTDLLNKKVRAGTVSVKTAVAAQTVSIVTSATSMSFNGSVTLSGVVSNQAANETVTIRAQSYGGNAFLKLADVKTGAGGAWTYTAHPTIRTVFDSMWGKNASAQLTVGVRPLVSIHALSGNRFSTKVLAAHSFAGKFVQLQRRSAGRWVTLKRVRLGSTSAAMLKASLPMGDSTLRFALSARSGE